MPGFVVAHLYAIFLCSLEFSWSVAPKGNVFHFNCLWARWRCRERLAEGWGGREGEVRGQRSAPFASLSFLWSVSHEHDNDHGIGDNYQWLLKAMISLTNNKRPQQKPARALKKRYSCQECYEGGSQKLPFIDDPFLKEDFWAITAISAHYWKTFYCKHFEVEGKWSGRSKFWTSHNDL